MMELERAMTLYDEPPVHPMKTPLSTVDQSQIADLQQQLQTPIIDSWLSGELPRQTYMGEGRRPPSGLQTMPPAVTAVNPVVPLVVEAKAAEDDDELPTRRRAERVRATTPFVPSSLPPHRPSYGLNPAAVCCPRTLTPSADFRQASLVPLSVCVPKDEPQTVPCVAGDGHKLVKKRERNRLAAQRCRQRKLEQISMLQERVEKLNAVKLELERTAEMLRRKLGIISHHYQQHVDAGCPLAPVRSACTPASAIHL